MSESKNVEVIEHDVNANASVETPAEGVAAASPVVTSANTSTKPVTVATKTAVAPGANGLLHHPLMRGGEIAAVDLHDEGASVVSIMNGATMKKIEGDDVLSRLGELGAFRPGTYAMIVVANASDEHRILKGTLHVTGEGDAVAQISVGGDAEGASAGARSSGAVPGRRRQVSASTGIRVRRSGSDDIQRTKVATPKNVSDKAIDRKNKGIVVRRHGPAGLGSPRQITDGAEGLDLVNPKEGEKVVLLFSSHALTVLRNLRSGTPVQDVFKPAIASALAGALAREGALGAGSTTEIPFAIRTELVTELLDLMRNRIVAVSPASAEEIADAIDHAIETKNKNRKPKAASASASVVVRPNAQSAQNVRSSPLNAPAAFGGGIPAKITVRRVENPRP